MRAKRATELVSHQPGRPRPTTTEEAKLRRLKESINAACDRFFASRKMWSVKWNW
jgi:hypothetical protein